MGKLLIAVTTILILGGCGLNIIPSSSSPASGPGTSPAPTVQSGTVGFTKLYQDVLAANCVSCHKPGGVEPNPDYSSYQAAIGGSTVVAGQMMASQMYLAVSDGAMPMTGALPASQQQEIGAWISQGAKP